MPKGGNDLIPVDELRDAIFAEIRMGRLSWSALARGMGYMRTRKDRNVPVGDTSRIKRQLGAITPGTRKVRVSERLQTHINYDNALRIATVAGLDPVDVGL